MTRAKGFTVASEWGALLGEVGISAQEALRKAGLPGDLFTRGAASLSAIEYYRLWRVLEEESDDPTLPLRIGRAISFEVFDPSLFAALCSPDLNVALERIRRFKPLLGPMRLYLEVSSVATVLEIEFPPAPEPVPSSLVALELVFFVQLARLATRTEVMPVRVMSSRKLDPARGYAEYFGTEVVVGERNTVTFSAADAVRPFLTANERMWEFFEPELDKRLSELDAAASISERVRGVLLELLPSGRSSIGEVSKALGVPSRTLQRHLRGEDTSFKIVLSETRERLARHYLQSTSMSGAEISFLLGYEDPNSFFRGFRGWTGETPEGARAAFRAER
jgi:AraC-like DNA-binding protein